MGKDKDETEAMKNAAKFSGGTALKPPKFNFDFKALPAWLREGEWKLSTYVTIAAVAFLLIASLPSSVQLFEEEDGFSNWQSQGNKSNEVMWRRGLEGVGIVWTVGVIVWLVAAIGWWPFVSYTVISWALLTFRFISISLGMYRFASIIRFPSMVMNLVTVCVWWLILVPAFLSFMNEKARQGFLRFNTNGLLINLHFVNLLLSLLDVYLHPRQLNAFDLWMAFAFGIAYVVFYLLVLDARGLYFYIIMCPRSILFVPSVALVSAIYFSSFIALNLYSTWCIHQLPQPPVLKT